MIPHNPATPDPHAVCAALRHARRNLCERIDFAADVTDQDFVHEFPTLVSAVEAGFRREQLVMELFEFPHLQERLEENAVILSALHRVTPAVEAGNLGLGRQVVGALRDLLDLHRLTADLALAMAIRPETEPARGYPARPRRPMSLHTHRHHLQ